MREVNIDKVAVIVTRAAEQPGWRLTVRLRVFKWVLKLLGWDIERVHLREEGLGPLSEEDLEPGARRPERKPDGPDYDA